LERAKRADMLDVVSHLCGLPAQLMPTAELARKSPPSTSSGY